MRTELVLYFTPREIAIASVYLAWKGLCTRPGFMERFGLREEHFRPLLQRGTLAAILQRWAEVADEWLVLDEAHPNHSRTTTSTTATAAVTAGLPAFSAASTPLEAAPEPEHAVSVPPTASVLYEPSASQEAGFTPSAASSSQAAAAPPLGEASSAMPAESFDVSNAVVPEVVAPLPPPAPTFVPSFFTAPSAETEPVASHTDNLADVLAP
jgi:hypothetical protein